MMKVEHPPKNLDGLSAKSVILQACNVRTMCFAQQQQNYPIKFHYYLKVWEQRCKCFNVHPICRTKRNRPRITYLYSVYYEWLLDFCVIPPLLSHQLRLSIISTRKLLFCIPIMNISCGHVGNSWLADRPELPCNDLKPGSFTARTIQWLDVNNNKNQHC